MVFVIPGARLSAGRESIPAHIGQLNQEIVCRAHARHIVIVNGSPKMAVAQG
jgi:hypothetical protein